MSESPQTHVAVIGGGQTGLTLGYFLKRRKIDFMIFDEAEAAGGAWRHAWPSLRLFSPAAYSSIAGWPMPLSSDSENPPANAVVAYLREYEARYRLPVCRPCLVHSVRHANERFRIQTDREVWTARALIMATGTWGQPFLPPYPGRDRSLARRSIRRITQDRKPIEANA